MLECDLLKVINKKRREMIKIGLNEGVTHENTVKCSCELDELLVFYEEKVYKNQYLVTTSRAELPNKKDIHITS